MSAYQFAALFNAASMADKYGYMAALAMKKIDVVQFITNEAS